MLTGKYPMSTVACSEGFRLMSWSMFPIVKYTGQADLSPLKRESCVLSDARMMGAMVTPFGKIF